MDKTTLLSIFNIVQWCNSYLTQLFYNNLHMLNINISMGLQNKNERSDN